MPLSKEVLEDAIRKAIELGSGRRFKQSVELQVVFKGVNPKDPEIKFREAVYLPKGAGKPSKIVVVADGEMLLKAREAGIDAYSSEEIKGMSKRQIKKLARQYDFVLVKADLMAQMGRILGPALGPRGKAPIPVPANADIAVIAKRYSNSVRLRNKEQAWVGCRIGTEDMSPSDLAENALAVIERIRAKYKRPFETTTKLYVKTTMGVPVEVYTI
ncbi:MAG: 50S ribosomal protein L1 [Desulfurococcales archaeon]|nr:50S ribosomal protein L1 [Desulfurococcales archaeon]